MASQTPIFNGFPREAIRFLNAVRVNNNRLWFDKNRAIYDACIVSPALAFVTALAAELAVFAPTVIAEPRVGGSLFRIHRDTRFSADKSPLKTHVGIRLRDKDTATVTRCQGPLFYVEFDALRLRLGVGVKAFDPALLAAYRSAVSSSRRKRVFAGALALAATQGHEVIGEMLARAPAGFADDGRESLLRRKGFFVQCETTLPKEILERRFVTHCAERFEPYASLFGELRRLAMSAAK